MVRFEKFLVIGLIASACTSVQTQRANGPQLDPDPPVGYVVNQQPAVDPSCISDPISVVFDSKKDKATVTPDDVPVDITGGKCHILNWTISADEGQATFGYVFFINSDGDVKAHANKHRHVCKKCTDGEFIVIPDWSCQSTTNCSMPVYLDLPDGKYSYGVQFWYQPPNSNQMFCKETDPDLEISGGRDPFDIFKRLLDKLKVLLQ